LLFDHSVLNGHPRFWGYITSAPAPIGALADLLAATVNPNVGGWFLAPMASELEAQTVRWIAEFLGYPTSCGGLLVSGGNMANFVCVLAARRARLVGAHPDGSAGAERQPRLYASSETHTWIQKAADLFGFGPGAVRRVETDAQRRMKVADLRRQIRADAAAGDRPFLVVGTSGTVVTGAIDPLPALADVCREEGLWFHVDGAYGAAAVALPDAPSDLLGLRAADSIAFDPHKWLYAPLEAGCALVRDPHDLLRTFSHRPSYYFTGSDEPRIDYHEYGPQNSRGFRALKVWLGFRHVGRSGYVRMIGEDVALARALFERVAAMPELEAATHSLSITTFRYVPPDLRSRAAEVIDYLNQLNRAVLTRLQTGGEAFLSNAVVDGVFLLRACIVNFRTTEADIAALPDLVVRLGAAIDADLRPGLLGAAGQVD
jgi:glutamate/tyrosine decarboxylase-like PLP-dependent enzyme